MPLFKSTYNILKKPDEDEVFNVNWMDSDKLILPPKTEWTYDREMTIEDVDIWEQLYFRDGGVGVYASWAPYAEFYLITTGLDHRYDATYIKGIPYWDHQIETYYGAGAQQKVFRRCKELGIDLQIHKSWVEDDKMWLYQNTL